MEILKINNISKGYKANFLYKIKANSKLLFLTIALLLVTLLFVIVLPMVLANKLEAKKADYPFVLNYISSSYNYMKDEQLKIIENNLNESKYNYDKTTFEMLNINNEGKYVIKNSEFNKIAKKLNLENVKLNKNETLIVPRFDNKRYKKRLNTFTEFEIGLYDLKVKGVAENKILPKGVGIWIVVVDDNLYSQLEKDDGNIKYYVNGYNYDNWETSSSIDEKIQIEMKKISKSNFYKKQDSFLSFPKIYLDSININNKLLFIDSLIGTILFVFSWRFLYIRLYRDLKIEKIKYRELSKAKLSYS